jgi:dnd system-associated protein 4
MRAIKRPEDFEDVVRLLTDVDHPNTGAPVFPTMRELLTFAAVLGFAEGSRTPLPDKVKEIDGRIFENLDQAMDLIYLIALAGAKDAAILQNENEDAMLRVFEEYAATGLGVIRRWLIERPDDVHGAEALLTAFRKYGYLGSGAPSQSIVPGDVTF